MFAPRLTALVTGGIPLLTDTAARRRGVLVAFAGRAGGVSAAPYDTLNLALRVGDEPAAVDENRRRVAGAAGFDPARLILARQVHGDAIFEARSGDAGVVGEFDGLVARASGPVLAILTADCAPVVIAGDRGVAVCHAGWRGVVRGVVERGLAAVGRVWGAWIGPSIHACCYEVGPEVIAAFEELELPVAAPGRVDPAHAAAAILGREGVASVAVAAECTRCDPSYFSYRGAAVTGRQGTFAALVS